MNYRRTLTRLLAPLRALRPGARARAQRAPTPDGAPLRRVHAYSNHAADSHTQLLASSVLPAASSVHTDAEGPPAAEEEWAWVPGEERLDRLAGARAHAAGYVRDERRQRARRLGLLYVRRRDGEAVMC